MTVLPPGGLFGKAPLNVPIDILNARRQLFEKIVQHVSRQKLQNTIYATGDRMTATPEQFGKNLAQGLSQMGKKAGIDWRGAIRGAMEGHYGKMLESTVPKAENAFGRYKEMLTFDRFRRLRQQMTAAMNMSKKIKTPPEELGRVRQQLADVVNPELFKSLGTAAGTGLAGAAGIGAGVNALSGGDKAASLANVLNNLGTHAVNLPRMAAGATERGLNRFGQLLSGAGVTQLENKAKLLNELGRHTRVWDAGSKMPRLEALKHFDAKNYVQRMRAQGSQQPQLILPGHEMAENFFDDLSRNTKDVSHHLADQLKTEKLKSLATRIGTGVAGAAGIGAGVNALASGDKSASTNPADAHGSSFVPLMGGAISAAVKPHPSRGMLTNMLGEGWAGLKGGTIGSLMGGAAGAGADLATKFKGRGVPTLLGALLGGSVGTHIGSQLHRESIPLNARALAELTNKQSAADKRASIPEGLFAAVPGAVSGGTAGLGVGALYGLLSGAIQAREGKKLRGALHGALRGAGGGGLIGAGIGGGLGLGTGLMMPNVLTTSPAQQAANAVSIARHPIGHAAKMTAGAIAGGIGGGYLGNKARKGLIGDKAESENEDDDEGLETEDKTEISPELKTAVARLAEVVNAH